MPPSLELERLKKLYELSMTLSGDPMEIFVHVARMIGELLAVKVVCLSEIRGRELHFLSVYVAGEVHVNAGHCPLSVTPCATVEHSKEIRVYDRVMERFPDATFLQQHRAYSYCGFPSLDCEGDVVAVTCLLDDQPHEFSSGDQELLQIVGQRIGIEIARKRLSDERQAAVLSLQHNEQRFRDIAEAAGEFIWEIDTEGRFTYLTDRVMEMYGYAAADLLGRTPFEFMFGEDVGWVRDFFLCVVRAKRRFRYLEHRIRARSGKVTWISVSGVPMLDQAGNVVGFRGTTADVTARKVAELASRESEELFRLIAETITEVFWITDSSMHTMFYVSPGYERVWQRARRDLLEKPLSFLDSIHPDDRDQALSQFALQQRDKPFEVEYRIIRPDGSIAWIWDRGFPVLDGDGIVTRHVGIAEDVTARKEAEIALRLSEERLELALQGAGLGFWDWNVPAGTVYFSDRWISMLGFERDEIEPSYDQWVRLVHPEDLPRVLPILEAHLAGTSPHYEIEHRLRLKDGTWKWVWSSGKVLQRDEKGAPLRAAGTHLDISGRKALERRIEEQRAQLIHAQRLTTAGELAAIIVHELNQPLGAIASYVGAALLEFASTLDAYPELRSCLDDTLRLTYRASNIARSIRDLVRKQEDIDPVPLDLHAVLEDALAYVRPELYRRQIELALEVATSVPPVRGDRIQLQQLFLNLLLNAMDAMELVNANHRHLTVRTSVGANQTVKTAIIDTGPGIAPAVKAKLFEPFVTSKKQGIGLGLSLCRTIAEAHGGRITARSSSGQGTCFEVVLPGATGEMSDDGR